MRHLLASLGLLLITAPVALANDYPSRKAGLWTVKMPNPILKIDQTHKECVDPSTDEKLITSSKGMTDCTNTSTKKGSSYIVDVACNTSGMNSTMHMELSGDFQTTYSGVMNIKLTGNGMELPEQRMTMTATYQGPCPEDMKPGDVIMEGMPGMPSGMRFNVLDHQK